MLSEPVGTGSSAISIRKAVRGGVSLYLEHGRGRIARSRLTECNVPVLLPVRLDQILELHQLPVSFETALEILLPPWMLVLICLHIVLDENGELCAGHTMELSLQFHPVRGRPHQPHEGQEDHQHQYQRHVPRQFLHDTPSYAT